MTLGGYLKKLREARKISKAELARKLEVAWTTINNWEKHGAVPGRAPITRIVEVLRLTTEEKAQLFHLAFAGAEPASEADPSSEPPSPSMSALEQLLTRALVANRHSFHDAVAVFQALRDASDVAAELGWSDDVARSWLDAAAWLRSKKRAVTASSLAVVVANLAPPVPQNPDESGTVRKVPPRRTI